MQNYVHFGAWTEVEIGVLIDVLIDDLVVYLVNYALSVLEMVIAVVNYELNEVGIYVMVICGQQWYFHFPCCLHHLIAHLHHHRLQYPARSCLRHG